MKKNFSEINALQHAIRMSFSQAIPLLLKKTDLGHTNFFGSTALRLLFLQEKLTEEEILSSLKELISAGANITEFSSNQTILYLALQRMAFDNKVSLTNKAILKTLLLAGADPHYSWSESPLDLAKRNKNQEITTLLVHYKSFFNTIENNKTSMYSAIKAVINKQPKSLFVLFKRKNTVFERLNKRLEKLSEDKKNPDQIKITIQQQIEDEISMEDKEILKLLYEVVADTTFPIPEVNNNNSLNSKLWNYFK